MIEVLSAVLRAASYLALALLTGGAAFLILCCRYEDPVYVVFRRRWTRRFPWLVLICVVTGACVLVIQAAGIVGRPVVQFLADRPTVLSFLFATRFGGIGVVKLCAAALVLIPALFVALSRSGYPSRWSLAWLATASALAGAIGPLAGHAAGDESTHWLVPFHIVHIVAMSVWLGGLPLWIGLVAEVGHSPQSARCTGVAEILSRFSKVAIVCMGLIVVSGVLLGWAFIDTSGDLLGTRYGALIFGKASFLLIVLLIANKARVHFLPRLHDADLATRFYPLARRWVTVELVVAIAILGLASVVSQATPAIHDQPHWWLPFRIAVDATWPVPATATTVSVAMAILIGAVLFLIRSWRHIPPGTKGAGIAAAIVAAGVAAWQLSVAAYPDTFRRSISPYLTVSITHGKHQFEQHCVACHGAGGLGDGSLAASLPAKPANLSEPHTALHTGGDMYWWLTAGIPKSGMPGFSAVMDEQTRWDVINFLRAFSQGFEARLLTAEVDPGRPWLGAPNFYFEGQSAAPREIKEFRETSNVLLVFPSTAPSEASNKRLDDLAASAEALRSQKLEVLVIDQSATTNAQPSLIRVRNEAMEIRETYDLFTRTVSDRGTGKRLGMNRSQHMEFLVDRFGYIRARWIPAEQAEGWLDLSRLTQEVRQLNSEPQLRPPPDDHIH